MATTAGPDFWLALIGQWIDNKYHIDESLGSGGFGHVFRASEVVNDQKIREVALKLIPLLDPQSEERQMEELHAAARSDHPNILRCYVSGKCTIQGFHLLYLVLEIAEWNLRQRLSRGTLTNVEMNQIIDNVASGLLYLHSSQVPQVHRDLKPENIMRVGVLWKIADFGLVRALGEKRVQRSGTVLGTPEYMPPEGWENNEISTAWDMWSLGVIIVEALAGNHPFDASSAGSLMRSVRENEPNIPDSLAAPFQQIARGCLTKDRATRWTAQQVLTSAHGGPVRSAAARRGQAGPSNQSEPGHFRRMALAAVLSIAAVGGIGYYHSLTPDKSRTIGNSLQSGSATPGAKIGPNSFGGPPKATGTADSGWGNTTVPTQSVGTEPEGDNERIADLTPSLSEVQVAPKPFPTIAAPTIEALEVVPNLVDQCSVVLLRWTVADATSVSLEPGVGTVNASGYHAWKPVRSGRFTLTAQGPGGTITRDIVVSVNAGPRTTCDQ